jgi:nucleoside-diphosphate-sugar epimerase
MEATKQKGFCMILITGGQGFIGHHLVKALLDNGEQVCVLDNSWRGDHKWPGVKYFCRDVRKPYSVERSAMGVDEIIHLAYINGTPNFYERPDEVLDVAVRGIVNVIEACRLRKIRKLTLVSSSEVCRAKLVDTEETIPLVIPDPYNPRYSYSAGKIISEMLSIHNAKLFDRLLIARPFNIYGPGMAPGHVIPDFMQKLKSLNGSGVQFEILGNGNETRSFCYIDDFIRGFMLMREKGGHMGIYNIGTPVETTIYELARRMAFIAGFNQLEFKQANKLREGDAKRRKPDIRKLKALGYRPKVSLDEGLRRVMA